jgi:hypothetical protein
MLDTSKFAASFHVTPKHLEFFPLRGDTLIMSSIAFPEINLNLKLADAKWKAQKNGFDLVFKLDSQDPRITPGMSIQAIVKRVLAQNVLLVPTNSIIHYHDKYWVRLAGTTPVCWQQIHIGAQTKEWTEVKEGLHKGDLIYPRL